MAARRCSRSISRQSRGISTCRWSRKAIGPDSLRTSTTIGNHPMATANNNNDHRRQEVQQIVKNACDQLNAEGVDARNYVEELAWLFFLKAFDETEARKEQEAAFDDTPYQRRLDGEYAWGQWAKNTDHADEMLEFVDGKLWIKLTSPDPKLGMGDDPLAQRFRRI